VVHASTHAALQCGATTRAQSRWRFIRLTDTVEVLGEEDTRRRIARGKKFFRAASQDFFFSRELC
jgi:hypothetical protein